MNISVHKHIRSVQMTVYPHDAFNMPFHSPRTEQVAIPSRCYDGLYWEFRFPCASCGKEVYQIVRYQSGTFIAIKRLKADNFNNHKARRAIGALFNLYDNNWCCYELKSRHTPSYFIYFRCQDCQAQYLLAYTMEGGEPNKNEPPDYVYLSGLAWVGFEEQQLLDSLI